MRKALIPALFVICGVSASRFWSTIGVTDEECKVDIVGAVAAPLFACVGTELLAKEVADPALDGAVLSINR
jgi:hypothetical protein